MPCFMFWLSSLKMDRGYDSTKLASSHDDIYLIKAVVLLVISGPRPYVNNNVTYAEAEEGCIHVV